MTRNRFVLLALPLVWVNAQTPTRYRVDIRSRDVPVGMGLELAEMIANTNTIATDHGYPLIDDHAPKPYATSALISVTSRDSGGGMLIHVRIDSISTNRFDGLDSLKVGMSAEQRGMLDSGAGGTIDAYVLHGKQLQLRIAPEMNIMVGQFASVLTMLFPSIQPGGKAGDRWTDSLPSDPTLWETSPGKAFSRDSVVAPLAYHWLLGANDTLSAELGGMSLWMLGNDGWSWRTTLTGTEHFLLDAARKLREAEIEITSYKSMNIAGKVDALSNKTVTTIHATQLGARP